MDLQRLLFVASFFLGSSVLSWAGNPSWFPDNDCGTLPHYDVTSGMRYSEYYRLLNRTNCLKDWTILVYMAADNDLTPYAFWDLYEMESGYESGRIAAGSTSKTDLVVQLDTSRDTLVRRLHIFQTPEAYDSDLTLEDFKKRNEKNVRSPVVQIRKENHELSTEEDLRQFLEWGVRTYPARHYMVVVWGHGQGWRSDADPKQPATSRFLSLDRLNIPDTSSGTPSSGEGVYSGRAFGGIAFKDSNSSFLSIPALNRVLKNVTQTVLEGRRTIDIYAADACLMQMIEVATEVGQAYFGTRGETLYSPRYVVGSTQVQDFLGLPYRRLLYELNTGHFFGARKSKRCSDNDEPCLMVQMIPEVFKASFGPQGLQGKISPKAQERITLSALSVSEIRAALLPALEQTGRALSGYLDEDPLRMIDLQFVIQNTMRLDGGAQDLGAFLGLVQHLLRIEAERTGVRTRAADHLIRTLASARSILFRSIMNSAFGTRYFSQEERLHLLGFRAVSVWIPVSTDAYRERITDFERSEFYQAVPSWGEWIKKVYGVD